MEITGHGLYRAEHRALRELYAVARQLCGHWERLAERIGGPPATVLRRGPAPATSCSTSWPAAPRSTGCTASRPPRAPAAAWPGVRNNAGDLLLERNQAMRVAVLDVQHLTTLLGYLGRLATTRGDEQLAGFHLRWEARLRELENEARDAAIELGCEPAAAVVPGRPGPARPRRAPRRERRRHRGRGDRRLAGRPRGAPLPAHVTNYPPPPAPCGSVGS